MLAEWIARILSNFDLAMFIISLFFMLLNRVVTRGRVPGPEIVYRWLALFPVGFTGIYAFIMHAFFPDLSAASIGWQSSPFQFEVAMADLAMGVLGVLSFNASYSFRLATVIATTIMLWGDAIGHVYQFVKFQNYSVGNAGSWFWMDLLLPLLLILCILRMKRYR